jgi:hypothetical protein
MGETTIEDDEVLDEYDFTESVRGKYVDRTNKIHTKGLEPDTAEVPNYHDTNSP